MGRPVKTVGLEQGGERCVFVTIFREIEVVIQRDLSTMWHIWEHNILF